MKAAFLESDIDRIIHIFYPFRLPNANCRKTHLLRKSLYGLRQALLLRFRNLREFLVSEMIYLKCQSKYSVFYKMDQDGNIFSLRPMLMTSFFIE